MLSEDVNRSRTAPNESLFEGVTAMQHSSAGQSERLPMMDIYPLAGIFPLSNGDTIVEHTLESEANQVDENHYETIPDSPDTDENVDRESETYANETIGYENLLPKRPDEKTPYSSLANIKK
ncbi:uncharacterized protein LOC127882358 [Dreissena polymorpha]|nr:uncharacterized protein LOC127882358 [Dreissena polymorpha]